MLVGSIPHALVAARKRGTTEVSRNCNLTAMSKAIPTLCCWNKRWAASRAQSHCPDHDSHDSESAQIKEPRSSTCTLAQHIWVTLDLKHCSEALSSRALRARQSCTLTHLDIVSLFLAVSPEAPVLSLSSNPLKDENLQQPDPRTATLAPALFPPSHPSQPIRIPSYVQNHPAPSPPHSCCTEVTSAAQEWPRGTIKRGVKQEARHQNKDVHGDTWSRRCMWSVASFPATIGS